MRKYLILFLLFVLSLPLLAENATNVRVRQEGKTIVVTYDLKEKSVVTLLMASGNSSQYTELKSVSGDVGKGVFAGSNREIVWRPLDENEKFVAKNVRFKVEAQSNYEYYTQNAQMKTLVMGQVGYSVAPQLSYGVMVGQMYKGIGWYVNGRSNFLFGAPVVIGACDEQGSINGVKPFYSGNTYHTHIVINGGFMLNVLEKKLANKFNTLGFYVGCGYGKHELYAETTAGEWIVYAPTFQTGFSGNVGLFGSVYGVTLNVGLNTINFKYMDLEVGIGYMF